MPAWNARNRQCGCNPPRVSIVMGILCFEPAWEQLLLDTSRWSIVSSLFPPDTPPLKPSPSNAAAIKASRNHSHEGRSVIIALQGESTFVSRGCVYPWQPGMVFLLNDFETHDGHRDLYRPLTYVECGLSEGALWAQVVSFRHGIVIGLSGDETHFTSADLGVRLYETWSEVVGRCDVSPENIRARMVSDLSEMVRKVLARPFGQRTSELSPAALIDRVCEHVKESRGSGVTLKSMARVTGYNLHHFAHLFRERTGVPLHQYVSAVRAQWTEHLLARRFSRAKIASMLGFSERRALNNWLRKQLSDENPLPSRPTRNETACQKCSFAFHCLWRQAHPHTPHHRHANPYSSVPFAHGFNQLCLLIMSKPLPDEITAHDTCRCKSYSVLIRAAFVHWWVATISAKRRSLSVCQRGLKTLSRRGNLRLWSE